MNSIPSVSAFAVCMTFLLTNLSISQEFGLPLDCNAAGVTCRIQQYVDMDTGKGTRDPYCSTATYEGHDGTDIRVLSMRDVAKSVPVIAMKAGTVLRVRDGEPDRLVVTQDDRAAVAGKECGNGLVVDFTSHEVQYCHLRKGSIVVAAGDTVSQGQKLGEIGASGLAQFPHVHITVRQNGSALDPMTGKAPSADAACVGQDGSAGALWSSAAAEKLTQMASPLLAAGISGAPPIHQALSVTGAPPTVTLSEKATIGWVWFANLQKGDQIKLIMRAPDGSVFSETVSQALDRNKADYSAYLGRKRAPIQGDWVLDIALLRAGKPIFEHKETVVVR